MALSSTEQWRSGFVVNSFTGALVTTSILANAVVWGGFLRDPDGRLVIA